MSSSLRIGIDVHSIGSHKGGNETYYTELVRGLSGLPCKHEFILYDTHPKQKLPIKPNPRINVKYVPSTRIVRIPLAFPWRMRKDKLDVFHAQYIVPPLPSCKTVVSIFDLAHERYPEFFHSAEAKRSQLLVRWSATRADHIVTVSKFSALDLVEIYGIPPEKITVTHLAASEDFKPMDRARCQEFLDRMYGIDFPFILYAGRLQARKNLVRLVEAYGKLRSKGISEKLVLIGKPDWRSGEITEAVKNRGLESDVVFMGFVPQQDLPVFFNAAELFIYPSIFEGFGLPVIESMACGIPTITSYGSSLEEVAGDAALLVDPLSTSSIAGAMETLLLDGDLRRSLGQKGVSRSSQFNYKDTVAKTQRVYENVHG